VQLRGTSYTVFTVIGPKSGLGFIRSDATVAQRPD
jgi:hypothetical protein